MSLAVSCSVPACCRICDLLFSLPWVQPQPGLSHLYFLPLLCPKATGPLGQNLVWDQQGPREARACTWVCLAPDQPRPLLCSNSELWDRSLLYGITVSVMSSLVTHRKSEPQYRRELSRVVW
jgi:hypothetical protein